MENNMEARVSDASTVPPLNSSSALIFSFFLSAQQVGLKRTRFKCSGFVTFGTSFKLNTFSPILSYLQFLSRCS